MDWSQIYLDTFIPELPQKWNASFEAFDRNLAVFYDKDRGVLIKPLETTGRVKGAKGEFVTITVDNLIVRNQFTNLYDNTTTADGDFVTAYTGGDASTRLATSDPSSASYDPSVGIYWPLEPSAYSWIDVNKPYFKISNDVSIAFQNDNLGQEFELLFDLDVATTADYNVLLQSTSEGPASQLNVSYSDASAAWVKLITVAYDVSYGPTWVVKQYGGTITIS